MLYGFLKMSSMYFCYIDMLSHKFRNSDLHTLKLSVKFSEISYIKIKTAFS